MCSEQDSATQDTGQIFVILGEDSESPRSGMMDKEEPEKARGNSNRSPGVREGWAAIYRERAWRNEERDWLRQQHRESHDSEGKEKAYRLIVKNIGLDTKTQSDDSVMRVLPCLL